MADDNDPIPVTDPPGDPPAGPDDVPLQAKVDQLERQVADYKLLTADLQTSMRRLSQDADRQKKFAAEPVVRDVLVVLDNLDRAVEAASANADVGELVKGVRASKALLADVLKRHGATPIEVGPGSAFDPNLHQAVMQQPSADHPPGAVTAVLQQGFLFHDRVLRPASVMVAAEG